MTCFTTDALMDMNAVIEVHEVRNVVHAHPEKRMILAKTCANRLQRGTGRPDLFMAGHAYFRWRHSGKCSALHGRVAIAAVDSKTRDVVFMTEGNRLFPDDVLIRDVGRTDNSSPNKKDEDDRCNSTEDREP